MKYRSGRGDLRRAISFIEVMFTLLIFCIMLASLVMMQSSNLRMVSRAQADTQSAQMMKSETEALLFENYDKLHSYSKTFDDEGNLAEGTWSDSEENSLVAAGTRKFAEAKWGRSNRFIMTVNVKEDTSRIKPIKKVDITVFVKSNLLGYIRYRGYLEKTKPDPVPGS